jgi:hypothetical protein
MSQAAVQLYMTKWLKDSTGGKVVGEFSLFNSRMRLRCTECDLTLTAPEPTGTTIDYGVQEFVKLHSHVGGHQTGVFSFTDGKPVPLTCDFKKIDVKPETAEKIVKVWKAFDQEYNAKFHDEKTFAAKIVQLQQTDKSKGLDQTKSVNPKTGHFAKVPDYAQMIHPSIWGSDNPVVDLLRKVDVEHEAKPEVKANPSGILRIATGRKFR